MTRYFVNRLQKTSLFGLISLICLVSCAQNPADNIITLWEQGRGNDNGMTWPEKYWLLLDEGNNRGYSCLTSIDENTIGIFYEGSQADMTFESIPLDDLINE